MPKPPIFIVGCPRSGTTLTRLMLDSHPDISCGPETHFLTDLERITTTYWHMLRRYGWEQDYWLAKVRTFFEEPMAAYATSRGKSRWAEKTPSYALHLGYVLTLFPEAQIIHVIRDPRDVVVSFHQRWGRRSAWRAPAEWLASVTTAQQEGARLGPGQYHEVRFEELVRSTEPTLRRMLEFLDEPWSDAVLAHDQADHRAAGSPVPAAKGSAASSRSSQLSQRARAATGRPVDESRAGAHERLNPLLRLRLRRTCGPLMDALGYG